jgi:integrase
MWVKVDMDRGCATVTTKGGKRHTAWLSEQAMDVLVRTKAVCKQRGRRSLRHSQQAQSL